MSEENATIEQNYLQMPYNKYLWLRKEFMCICDNDELEAMIMRVIEYEIEGDRRVWLRKATELAEQGKEMPEEPEWWITLSHKQIMARIYDATKNEKTLRAKLQSLQQKQFLLVRSNPDCHYGSPQYTINKQLVQSKLDALPPLPSAQNAAKSQVASTDPLPKVVPPTKSGTPYQNYQGPPPKTTRGEVPKLPGASSQNHQGGGTKSGTPNKKIENITEPLKTSKKDNDIHESLQATDRSSSKKDLLSSASPEVQFIINEWRACCGKPVRVNKTLIDNATKLVPYQLLPGEMASIVQRMREKDKTGWYQDNGLHLGNVVNELQKHPPNPGGGNKAL